MREYTEQDERKVYARAYVHACGAVESLEAGGAFRLEGLTLTEWREARKLYRAKLDESIVVGRKDRIDE